MIRGALAMALFAGGMQGQALAQSVENKVEALGFVGGVTDNGGFTFGGGLQVGLNSRLLGVAEVGYIAVDGDNVSAVSVDLNAHYLFPTGNSKMTPYLLGGLGIIKTSVSVGTVDVSDTDAGLNLGGGLRIDGGTNWGLRPEVKFLLNDNTSARLSVGFFYTF
jgi:opacity protein-like surface antigen